MTIDLTYFQVKGDKTFQASGTPDLLSFTVSGLQGIADQHGPESSQAVDASKLVSAFVDKVWTQLPISDSGLLALYKCTMSG